ncbi:MAG: hypothetical protein ACTIJN_11100 [Microbacterium gubbeenense]|uniref:hypothetical protein n=1 Tax=Microbacterium gubbeenense TaxID=159896 RepID=UPI003F945159
MKLKHTLASAAAAIAVLVGGGAATGTAAFAAPDRAAGTGPLASHAACVGGTAVLAAQAIMSGGTNIDRSCGRGGGDDDGHLWYGLVTWDAY